MRSRSPSPRSRAKVGLGFLEYPSRRARAVALACLAPNRAAPGLALRVRRGPPFPTCRGRELRVTATAERTGQTSTRRARSDRYGAPEPQAPMRSVSRADDLRTRAVGAHPCNVVARRQWSTNGAFTAPGHLIRNYPFPVSCECACSLCEMVYAARTRLPTYSELDETTNQARRCSPRGIVCGNCMQLRSRHGRDVDCK